MVHRIQVTFTCKWDVSDEQAMAIANFMAEQAEERFTLGTVEMMRVEAAGVVKIDPEEEAWQRS